ncbi:hypothetical protein VUR80DRAFT_8237 [Thermomyces stellatus]
MSSEARLYSFSQETKDQLRKFRLGTSRAKDPQAVICMYVWARQKQADPRRVRVDLLPPGDAHLLLTGSGRLHR